MKKVGFNRYNPIELNNGNFLYNKIDQIDHMFDYLLNLYKENDIMNKFHIEFYKLKNNKIRNLILNDLKNNKNSKLWYNNFITKINIDIVIKKKLKKSNAKELLTWNIINELNKLNDEILYIGCKGFVDNHHIPRDCMVRFTKFILKKAGKYKLNKMRSITQGNMWIQLIGGCIKLGIHNKIEPKLDWYQGGGKDKRSCDDQISSIYMLIEYNALKLKMTMVIQSDIIKAFDWSQRDLSVFDLYDKFDVMGNMWMFIDVSYQNGYIMVDNDGLHTGKIKIVKSSMQGAEESMDIFNVNYNRVGTKLNSSRKGIKLDSIKIDEDGIDYKLCFQHSFITKNEKLIEIILNHLSFCDDMSIICDSMYNGRYLFKLQQLECKLIGYGLGFDKTKIMIFNRKYLTDLDLKILNNEEEKIRLDDNIINIVFEMEILGHWISCNKKGIINNNKHINILIDNAQKQLNLLIYKGFSLYINNIDMNKNIWHSILESKLTYGSRSIIYNKSNIKKLILIQNKFLKTSLNLYKNTDIHLIRIITATPPIIVRLHINFLLQYYQIVVHCRLTQQSPFYIYLNLLNLTKEKFKDNQYYDEGFDNFDNIQNLNCILDEKDRKKKINNSFENKFYGNVHFFNHIGMIQWILNRYGLIKYFNFMEINYNKLEWKQMITKKIEEYYYKIDIKMIKLKIINLNIITRHLLNINDSTNYNKTILNTLDNFILNNKWSDNNHRKLFIKIIMESNPFKWKDNNKLIYLKCPYCLNDWKMNFNHLLLECNSFKYLYINNKNTTDEILKNLKNWCEIFENRQFNLYTKNQKKKDHQKTIN